MKINLKRISRRSISMLLCVLIIFSTLVVGQIYASADTIDDISSVYLTGTMNNWDNGVSDSWKLTAIDSNHYQGTFTIPGSSTNYEFRIYCKFSNSSGSYAKGGYWFTSTNTTYTENMTTDAENDQIQCIQSTGNIDITVDFYGNYSGKSQLTVTQKASSSTGSVSDDIISVLNGTKIMFYIGNDWDKSKEYIYQGDNNTTQVASTTNGGYVTAPAAKYYITHSTTWAGIQMSDTAIAGYKYVTNSDGGDHINFTESSGSATTTISNTNVVSTSFTAGQSGAGNAYTLVYYIKDSSDTYTKIGTSATEVNTYISALEDGTYTLFTCSTDTQITVLRDTDVFTKRSTYKVTTGVKVSTDGTKYTVDNTKTNPTGGGDVSVTDGTTLEASEITGYTFVGWEMPNGNITATTDKSLSYTPTADNTTVYALYKQNYTVTIGTHTNGTIKINGTATDKTVPAGTEVTIVASPSDGYKFSAWTGDLSSETSATVTMNVVSNITANATFTSTAKNYYYAYWNGSSAVYKKMEKQEGGSYIYNIVKDSNEVQLDNDNKYKLKITNNSVTDDGNDGKSMDKPEECVNYNINTNNITFSNSISTTTKSIDSRHYNILLPSDIFEKDKSGENTLVLQYTPSSENNGLSGNVKIWTKYDYDVAHGINYKHTVTFSAGTEPGESTVSAKVGENKIVSGTEVDRGTEVTFIATPADNYTFDGWYDNESYTGLPVSTDATYTVTVNADVTLYAKFTRKPVATSVTITATPNEIYDDDATGATLTATVDGLNANTENLTYVFRDANGKMVGSGSSNTCTVKPTTTTFYSVTVSAPGYLDVSSTENATVTVKKRATYYLTGWLNGDAVTTAQTQFKFTHVSNNVYELTYKFTGDQDGSQYTTIFDGTNAYHPAELNSGSGIAASDNKTDTYPNGDPKWKVEAKNGIKVKFTWDANTKVLSWVIVEDKYTVTVSTSQGTVTVGSETSASVTAQIGSTPVSINANNNDTDNYIFDHWEVTGGATVADANNAETTATATAEGTITAVYKRLYSIQISPGTGNPTVSAKVGETTLNDNPAKVKEGTVVVVTGEPAVGYEPTSDNGAWVVEGSTGSINNDKKTCTVTVNKDTKVTFNTQKIKYNITYEYIPENCGTSEVQINGTIAETLSIGDTFTVKNTVNSGYELNSIVVKAGEEILLPENGVYTMTTGNVTVTVTFKEKLYTVTIANSVDSQTSTVQAGKFTSVGIEAPTKPGYVFSHWTVNDNEATVADTTSANTTVTATKDTTITAVYTQVYTVNYDFTNKHVSSFTATYTLENSEKTLTVNGSDTTSLSGNFLVDKGTNVEFTVKMKDGYKPIPDDKSWSGATGGTISNNGLTYTFSPTGETTVNFYSYHQITITTSEKVNIGSSVTITINSGYDSSVDYKLFISKDSGSTFSEYSSECNNGVFTTSALAYGSYVFKVQQTIAGYSEDSNTVNVKAVLGNVVLVYTYKEYKSENGVPYDPYIDINENLNSESTTYTKNVVDADISNVKDNVATTYKTYAPSIKSNYFDYDMEQENDKNIHGELITDENGTFYRITGSELTPTPKIYNVSVYGSDTKNPSKFTSYYQQKTFLLDAKDYTGEALNGYMWYYLKADGSKEIVSTGRYYKLRVARDTVLYVGPIEEAAKTPVTIINDPVYNQVNVNNVLKIQMNMLVENYLPEGAVRTRTGVAYCAYTGTQPTINSTDLIDLIHNSQSLAESKGGICEIGKLNNDTVTIKGYYTKQDNENGKFIFAPTAKLDSQKTYLVYSYLTYTMNNRSVTIVSEHPVTASIALYNDQKNQSTNS